MAQIGREMRHLAVDLCDMLGLGGKVIEGLEKEIVQRVRRCAHPAPPGSDGDPEGAGGRGTGVEALGVASSDAPPPLPSAGQGGESEEEPSSGEDVKRNRTSTRKPH